MIFEAQSTIALNFLVTYFLSPPSLLCQKTRVLCSRIQLLNTPRVPLTELRARDNQDVI